MENDPDGATPLTVGVPREIAPLENRVALVPDTVSRLAAAGFTVFVEKDAGLHAGFTDDAYVAAGAEIAPDARTLYERANIVTKVQGPRVNEALGADEVDLMQPGTVLIGFLDPLRNSELMERLVQRGVIAFSMERIPRITRAQSMDALSSMSTIAGYKAVLLGATALGKLFPMLMTAAGTLAPARVLVLGAGVAGLQALATARRLGAVTEGFDTRAVVKEQVQSVGATFIEMPEIEHQETEAEGGYAREMSEEFYKHEQDAIRDHVARADVVITTAQVPGKRAPILITEEMVASMHPGSVIVDLAAESGGNCTLTELGKTVVKHEVVIMGPQNVPGSVPSHASQMYSRNMQTVLNHLVRDGKLELKLDDEITQAAASLPREAVAS